MPNLPYGHLLLLILFINLATFLVSHRFVVVTFHSLVQVILSVLRQPLGLSAFSRPFALGRFSHPLSFHNRITHPAPRTSLQIYMALLYTSHRHCRSKNETRQGASALSFLRSRD